MRSIVGRILERLRRSLREGRRRREAEEALYGMSDHLLRDIGLRPEDIPAAVRDGVVGRTEPEQRKRAGRHGRVRGLAVCPLCGARRSAA